MSGHQLLLLSKTDNVLVALGPVDNGLNKVSDGNMLDVVDAVALGHKVARCPIMKGEKIIKYGVPIGSALCDIAAGQHVHVHNMKSDYTPTYALEETAGGNSDD